MNILVINLTRFGDLLQTQPLFHALKAQGHRVGLLCLKNFAPATALLQDVDYVAVLPGALLLADMDADWCRALTLVQSFVQNIERDFPVQGIVNTTATLSARLLTRRLVTGARSSDPVAVWGFALDEDGFGCNGNVWTTFLQGSTVRRLNCPFNIVDMFRMAAGCGEGPANNFLRPPSPEVQQEAQALLQAKAELKLAGAEAAGYVSFQLGASEARRQWPVEYFARLGEWLWTELRLCPLLLGAASERPLAEAYAAVARSPFADCVGETDIPHLAALLRCSKLLVTNDTGTMHLAAGLDIPVLAIFLATAQPWDTGPYRNDCCCLEPALACHPCAFASTCPHDNICLRAVRPQQVWELVSTRLRTGQWCFEEGKMLASVVQDSTGGGEGDSTEAATAGARVWISGRDAYGFAHLRCVSQHGGEDRSLWLELQRHFYRHILDAMDASAQTSEIRDFPLPPAALGQQLSAPFRDTVHKVLRQAESLLLLLAEQGLMVQQVPGPLPGQRLLASCNRIRTLFEQCVPLCALGHLWTVIVQERGDDLQAIIRMARIMQHALGQWRAYLETEPPK